MTFSPDYDKMAAVEGDPALPEAVLINLLDNITVSQIGV